MNENPPVLRIVSGRPTREEVAVVTAVLLSLTAARADRDPFPSRRKVPWTHEFDYQTGSSWRAA